MTPITLPSAIKADWATACLTIRSVNPDALIVGPNEAYYDSRFMPEFLSAAKAGHVLPDIISWHELSPDSLRTYRSSYASYRELEQQLGSEMWCRHSAGDDECRTEHRDRHQ